MKFILQLITNTVALSIWVMSFWVYFGASLIGHILPRFKYQTAQDVKDQSKTLTVCREFHRYGLIDDTQIGVTVYLSI